MVDMSHANSRKQYQLQVEVAGDVSRQLADGRAAHIRRDDRKPSGGGQAGRSNARPVSRDGQSITDACIGWEDSERCLEQLAEASATRAAPLRSLSIISPANTAR